MIFRAYQTLSEFNRSGISNTFRYVADTVPIFMPMLLFTFFIVAAMGIFFARGRASGEGDIISALAAASYTTLILAVVASLIPNLITLSTLLVVVSVAIICTFLLLVTERR